ncbi:MULTISPECIES: DUF4276 family protein [Flavobacterium]|uniref:DUF4276 family protein n=1 Tax=Flavobacterium johnsoniae (strain ATCC 17061 / DSM 2064 / JCM 8514 / BCRC 14874 / CCUG 350202 / NBRC 14942 / NCIMB 11054 / UW101) TaxID=376686 RepID=A5FDK7_FLAJ1|nr:DUF4276 family protein [Flavobacterium johnsoniae]ABQ06721.1 hypothetical protein Fjoh_3707 [Flavobacterium johnsoniae UW101]OXE95252.1 hypothetical protein B0A63_25085 [Flavobacterium johnsoniae UW101]WQG82478.1 DUF4276 family protein [Flavobacterium johnsoniae UW101]SHM02573.1 protein of unknown function [Flavobacterium johnsoniae]
MKRVHIIVEGQTEVRVFYSILVPYIQSKVENVYIEITPIKHSAGGIVKYSKLLPELRNHLADKEKIVTTFFDYYGLLEKHNFPKYKEAKIDQTNSKVGVVLMEDGLKDDLASQGISTKNFIPYIQLHEFEALLFSSDEGFEFQYDNPRVLRDLKAISPRYQTPEDINDSPVTAPSKRIIGILEKQGEKYEKVIDGDAISIMVGIEAMMEKCPRFKAWVETLILKILA